MTILDKLSSYHILSRQQVMLGAEFTAAGSPDSNPSDFNASMAKRTIPVIALIITKPSNDPKKHKNTTSPPVERVKKSQRPATFSLEDDHLEEDNNQHPPNDNEESNTTCKFAFYVYWDCDLKRWFIPQKQSGCKCHNGHPHVEHPMLRIQPRHAIPINEIGALDPA